MKEIRFPKITVTVEAKPWPADYVAHVTSLCTVKKRTRQHRIIEAHTLSI